MNCWAVNNRFFDEEERTIHMESKRSVNISNKDHVVIFNSKGGDINFTHHGIIDNIDLSVKNENLYIFTGNLPKVIKFKEIRVIKDLLYSVTKIYRYDKPRLHFRRPYIRLTTDDFDTIINDQIFWSRSGFGFFVRELSDLQFAKFLSYLVDSDPTFFLSSQSYSQVWSQFKSFIIQEFLAAINLFKALKYEAEHIEDLDEENFIFDDLKLSSDENNNKIDNISHQARLFDDLAESLYLEHDEKDLFSEIDSAISDNEELEIKFEKKFRGKPWPIRTIEL